MELVTGFAGTAHVDPVDSAHLNAAAFGPGAYLLGTQNKLKASLKTANKLVVDTGDLMIQGHHFTVVEPEEVSLQSGVSGKKRNALVCARYNKTESTGVESASWVVKYGTSTTGTPTDPKVTTGNILNGVASVHEEPIFRIEYNGITPGNPILLVPEFQSASEFRTSIAQAKPEDCSGLLTMNKGFSLVEATVLKAGPLKRLYVKYRSSQALPRDGNVRPFTVKGDLMPKQMAPISSDIVSGTIFTDGISWVTYLQPRNANQDTSLCSAFYM